MKTCTKCKEFKSVTLFYTEGARRYQCKQCDDNATNAYRYANGRRKISEQRIKSQDEIDGRKLELDRNRTESLAPSYVAAKLHIKVKELTPYLLQLGRERLLTSRSLRDLSSVIKKKLKENNES